MQIKILKIPENKRRLGYLLMLLLVMLNSCVEKSGYIFFNENENIAYWDAYPFNTIKTEINDTVIGLTYKFSKDGTFDWYPYHVEKNIRIKYIPVESKSWKIINQSMFLLDKDTIHIEKYDNENIYLYRIIQNDTLKFYFKRVKSMKINVVEEKRPIEISM